jgi:NAD(P)-dependent dehydrogenase (short-subunit alcohol dehydrogenase family)
MNIASLAAVKNGLGGAAYVASKSGLMGLTKNTAAIYGLGHPLQYHTPGWYGDQLYE